MFLKIPRLPSQVLTITTLTALIVLTLVLTKSLGGKSAFAQQQGGRDEIRIELTSDGFAPSEVQHAPGIFAIAVENKTLTDEYTLKLKAADGTVLNEFQVQKGSSSWTVNLPTGTYKLHRGESPSVDVHVSWSQYCLRSFKAVPVKTPTGDFHVPPSCPVINCTLWSFTVCLLCSRHINVTGNSSLAFVERDEQLRKRAEQYQPQH